MLKVAVLGATGRMGRTLTRLIAASDDLQLVGAATEPDHPLIGQDAGAVAGVDPLQIVVTDQLDAALADSRVVIDFTLPSATDTNLQACVGRKVALVMGTTGLSGIQMAALAEAGRVIPLVYGRNMSVGVNVTTALVDLATRALGEPFDVEITEAHHRNKLDAPSGTALQLGEAVAGARGVSLEDAAVYARHGNIGARPVGAVGFSSIRAGSIVGEHSVLFAADEETVEIRHRAMDRAVFAQGALRAVRWVSAQPAGLYGMRDVLQLAR